MESLEMGLKEVAAAASAASVEAESSTARGSFRWGGTIWALFLLILNRFGWRSPTQNSLLVLYLLISFPTVLFNILRGQFGCWVAFLAVAANLFFPQTFPVFALMMGIITMFSVSRFLLFVITPDWLADSLRDSIAGGVFCLIIGLFLIITEIREAGGFSNCECNFYCFGYNLGIAFLLFFTILYLCLGTW